MQQLSFTDAEQVNKQHKISRERFLEGIDKLIPWNKVESLITIRTRRLGLLTLGETFIRKSR